MFKNLIKKILFNKIFSSILLKIYVKFDNHCYKVISFLAIKLNNGFHPKHNIIKYHNFFIDNLTKDDAVLDVGCGNGYLAYKVSNHVKNIIAIDIDHKKVKEAQKKYKDDNVEFLVGDATEYNFKEKFDVVILSNVLEHIDNRVEFLKKISNISNRILIRVPMITRDWLSVYKKEMGYEYRLDMTHYIEYTREKLYDEFDKSEWRLQDEYVDFGEFYALLQK